MAKLSKKLKTLFTRNGKEWVTAKGIP